MSEKTSCESKFKQNEMTVEDFTAFMAKMINSLEKSNAMQGRIIY